MRLFLAGFLLASAFLLRAFFLAAFLLRLAAFAVLHAFFLAAILFAAFAFGAVAFALAAVFTAFAFFSGLAARFFHIAAGSVVMLAGGRHGFGAFTFRRAFLRVAFAAYRYEQRKSAQEQ